MASWSQCYEEIQSLLLTPAADPVTLVDLLPPEARTAEMQRALLRTVMSLTRKLRTMESGDPDRTRTDTMVSALFTLLDAMRRASRTDPGSGYDN